MIFGATDDEFERRAYITHDRTALRLLELAEDAAGLEAERVRERRAELLAQSRGVLALRAELAEQTARMHEMQRQLAHARELESTVHFVLRPFANQRRAIGVPLGKPVPKWAEHLRATLQRIAIKQNRP